MFLKEMFWGLYPPRLLLPSYPSILAGLLARYFYCSARSVLDERSQLLDYCTVCCNTVCTVRKVGTE